ncbi:hypothetical protein Drorol1_Dr00015901 [Drosera rotundifolia]
MDFDGDDGLRSGDKLGGYAGLGQQRQTVLCWANWEVMQFPTILEQRTGYAPDGNTMDLPSSAMILGFGYDYFSDDYKVITISQAMKAYDHQIVETTKVDVYSLNKDSWQSYQLPWSNDQYVLQLGLLCYSYQRSSVVVNNAVHWHDEKYIGKNKNRVIIAFDLRYVGKYWEVVVLPQFLAAVYSVDLKVLGGFLSLWSDGLELWIMREYGVVESWTRTVKLDPNGMPRLSSGILSGFCKIISNDENFLTSTFHKTEDDA